MRTLFLIVFGTAFCILTIGSGYLIYRLNLILPENSAPTQAEYPQAALDLFKLTKSKLPDSMPEWMNYSSSAARRLFDRLSPERYEYVVGRDWHINFFLASIWVSLRWSEKEKLNTILDEQGYGPRAVWEGLEQASQGFFAVSARELSIPEVAVLIVNSKAFSNYDPWCDRQAVEEEVLKLLDRYKQAFPEVKFSADQMFARLQTRECRRYED